MRSSRMRKGRFSLSTCIAALLLLSACGIDTPPDEQDRRFAFPTPTNEELEAIRTMWADRDLAARKVMLLEQDDRDPDFSVRIYEHRVGENTHYGAVSIPKAASTGSMPVVVFADGLAQSDPTIDVGARFEAARAILNHSIFAIPAFRGRTLIYKGLSFPADGDFCDAYDGAADDAIAFLNVVADNVEEADLDRVMVRGGSRGGNTSLLLAQREPRIKVAVAIAAPTDFNRAEVRLRYPDQFECQFVNRKDAAQSRQRILASSPLYFDPLPNVEQVHLLHGTGDTVVPIWNATEMAARLQAQGSNVLLHTYEGYGHEDIGSSEQFRADQESILRAFLQ